VFYAQKHHRSWKDRRTFWYKRTLTSHSSARLLEILNQRLSGRRLRDRCRKEGEHRKLFIQLFLIRKVIQKVRDATTLSKLRVQFLGLGYYYPSTEKNRQVYPVWCRQLHNHTLFIKKLRKKLWVQSKFRGIRTPNPPVVAPMDFMLSVCCMDLSHYLHI